MSSVTYDRAAAAAPAAPAADKPKGRLARFFDRLAEARMRQAMLEVQRYGIVLPRELERADWKFSARSEDSLPFKR